MLICKTEYISKLGLRSFNIDLPRVFCSSNANVSNNSIVYSL